MGRGENTDCAPGSGVPQDDPQHSGGEDDQPGHQAAVAQPAVVQLGAEERKGALVANRGQEEGSQHQDLQTGEVRGGEEKQKLSTKYNWPVPPA